MSKYIITDLDGTLFQNKFIREVDLLKFVKFVEDGNKIILNTGRSATLISHFLKTLPIDYAICNNGSLIIDKDMNVLYKAEVDVEELNSVVKNIKKPSTVYATNGFDHEQVNGDITVEDPIFLSITPNSRKYKHASKIIKKLQPHLNTLEATQNSIYVDIASKECTKATGIKFLQEKLDILDKDIYVFGDNINDIPMFQEYYFNSYFINSGNEEAEKFAKYKVDYVSDIIEMDEIFDIH